MRSKAGEKALVAIGSNVTSRHGTPRQTVTQALAALDRGPLALVAGSRLYLTPFVPAGAGDDVVNAVALVRTELGPEALLAHLHGIEAAFGRSRGERWTGRTLDLDLVAMEDRILPDTETLAHWIDLPFEAQKREAPDVLVLPHPRLQERAFVLVPAAEIAPGWTHPLTGRSLAEMRDALPPDEVAAIKVLGD